MNVLEKNKFVYETLFDVFFKSDSHDGVEKKLSKVAFLASFAWFAHPGHFADARLERLCFRIGKEIWDGLQFNEVRQKEIGRRSVLHVVSETYSTGGHTRLIFNIIRNDTNSIHSLLLTQQKVENIPKWLSEQVILSGGSISSVCQYSPENQVGLIQKAVTSSDFNTLFYHIHPDDAVAVAALAAAPRPAALIINHADHIFWLGSTLADVTVCYRTWSMSFSEQYRGSQRVALLPTPIGALNIEKSESLYERKINARKKLGIADDKVVILTVASYGKFIPAGKYNYFRVAKKILDENPNVLLKIVGISKDDDLDKLQYIHTEQIEFLGVVSEPKIYYEAADVYLDSMPFSSFTSLFEAIFFGCYPVLQFSPVDTLTIENEPALKNVVFHTNSEEEQVATLQYAIDNPKYRQDIAMTCARLVEDNYMGIGWVKQLNNLYSNMPGIIQDVENLHSLKSPVAITENDVEAALLARAQHGEASIILSKTFIRYFHSISTIEIIKIYFRLIMHENSHDKLVDFKQLLYFMKRKLLNKAG